ncbi:MAG: AAA family ATPase, partial [Phascolarctobacterium sp.]|nr:AAA family ATPase [Candidatus Phascolarctobacterium caballi]
INYLSYIDFVKNFIKDSKGKFKNFVEVSKAALENNDFNQKNISSENTSIYDGKNILFYGVPGCGKSYHIKTFYVADSHNNDNERVVFHPDYTYSDFIGQILPQIKNDKIVYEFVPGPFTRLLAKAINNPNQKYYLIIEEINRGNAAAIFGDIFQLLDRKNGKSEYEITNKDIAIQVYGKGNEEKKVYIPGNMSIFATMNTADQNVFTLDTAFQRRWQMKHIPNNFDDSNNQEQSNRLIPGKDNITWGIFAQRVNKKILESNSTFGSTADKSLGVYFIKPDEFKDENSKKIFGEKILKYLWDDAFKMNHEEIFNKNIHSLAEALKIYENEDSFKNVLYEGFFSNENLKKDDIDYNESK